LDPLISTGQWLSNRRSRPRQHHQDRTSLNALALADGDTLNHPSHQSPTGDQTQSIELGFVLGPGSQYSCLSTLEFGLGDEILLAQSFVPSEIRFGTGQLGGSSSDLNPGT
jgi:hypothetical protein